MEDQKKLIVVPWDFTHVAEHALAHAVKISRMVGNDICLLHIVDPGINTKLAAGKRAQLQKLTEEYSKSTIYPFLIIFLKEAFSHPLLNLQMRRKPVWLLWAHMV